MHASVQHPHAMWQGSVKLSNANQRVALLHPSLPTVVKNEEPEEMMWDILGEGEGEGSGEEDGCWSHQSMLLCVT